MAPSSLNLILLIACGSKVLAPITPVPDPSYTNLPSLYLPTDAYSEEPGESSSTPTPTPPATKSKSHTGQWVGIALGIFFFLLLVALIFYYSTRRRQNKQRRRKSSPQVDVSGDTDLAMQTQFHDEPLTAAARSNSIEPLSPIEESPIVQKSKPEEALAVTSTGVETETDKATALPERRVSRDDDNYPERSKATRKRDSLLEAWKTGSIPSTTESGLPAPSGIQGRRNTEAGLGNIGDSGIGSTGLKHVDDKLEMLSGEMIKE